MTGGTAAMAMLALAGSLMLTPAFAQNAAPPEAAAPTAAAKPARPAPKSGNYYIEFRAARIGIYGHSYVAYGRLGPNGKLESTTYADRHPVGNYATMALGHIVPVPANTEWDPEVLDLPVGVKYRIRLNDTQYNKLLAARKSLDGETAYWNAVTNNCNHYVGKLAEAVGLRVPAEFHLSMGFLPDLIEMNEKTHPSLLDPSPPAARRKSPPTPQLLLQSRPPTPLPRRVEPPRSASRHFVPAYRASPDAQWAHATPIDFACRREEHCFVLSGSPRRPQFQHNCTTEVTMTPPGQFRR